MAKKLEVNYDRNIYTQLEETLLKVEKLQAEITELKAFHSHEIYLLNESHRKTVKELKKSHESKLNREIYLQGESHSKRVQTIEAPYKKEILELKAVIKAQGYGNCVAERRNSGVKSHSGEKQQ